MCLSPERESALRKFAQDAGIPDIPLRMLNLALTHPSYSGEHPNRCEGDNQRLEYLGDAVVGLAVSGFLFHTYPEWEEGRMTKVKSWAVSAPVLRRAAEKIGVGELLLLGRGEENSGGRRRPSILGDAFECVAAAIYLCKGFEAAAAWVVSVLRDFIEEMTAKGIPVNAKGELQEITQRCLGVTPTYHLLEAVGPDHAKVFTVEVRLQSVVLAQGQGTSKKNAEQDAAGKALRTIRDESGAFRPDRIPGLVERFPLLSDTSGDDTVEG